MASPLDFRVKNGLVVATTATILTSTNAVSTTSGALQVTGGAGIGRDLWVGGTIYGSLTGTATNAITATNLAGGAGGSIPYQSGSGVTTMLPIATTSGWLLRSTGSVPQWINPNDLTADDAATVNTVARTTNAAHFLTFVDSNNASATAESIYTTSSFVINPATGNIGIGSPTPQRRLVVQGSSATVYASSGAFSAPEGGTQASIYNTSTVAGSFGALVLAANGPTSNINIAYIAAVSSSTGFTPDLVFGHRTGNTSYEERMRLDVNGNFGIGTTTPTSRLDVNGDVTITDKIIHSGDTDTVIRFPSNNTFAVETTGVERIRVDPFGNVGINNAAPGVRFHVIGNSANTFTVSSTVIEHTAIFSPSNQVGNLSIGFNTSTADAYIFSGYTGGALIFGTRVAPNNIERFRITANGGFSLGSAGNNVGTAGQILTSDGDAPPSWTNIGSVTAGTATNVITAARTTNASHFLTFVDSNNASGTAEAVYTTSSVVVNPSTGNVGIGSISNGYKLTIESTNAGQISTPLMLGNNDSTTGSGTAIDFSALSGIATVTGRISNVRDGSGLYSLRFSTYGIGGGALGEAMRIDSAGNVGIRSTPSAWTSTWPAIQFGGQGPSIAGSNIVSQISLSSNGYFNGTNWIYNNSASAGQYQINGNTHYWYTAAAGSFNTTIPFTQAMTLNENGHLLLGTNSALYSASNRGNITVNGTSSSIVALGIGGVASGYFYTDSNKVEVGSPPTKYISFNINGERMQIDTAGNIGIGITPSAWSWDGRVIDGTNNMVISANGNYLAAVTNVFWDGTGWKYKTTSQSTRYEQASGQHIWLTAGSGTAGTYASYAQVMTLDTLGRLGIGVTSPARILDVAGTARLQDASALEWGGVSAYISGSSVNNILLFNTASAERVRIDASGNIGIGTTSPITRLDVSGGTRISGITTVTNTTNASSTTTGALQVSGGVGVGGNLYVGGEIVAQKLTIQLTTVTTTSVETDDIIKTSNTTNASSTITGALQVAGGAGVGRDLYVGGTIYGNISGTVTGNAGSSDVLVAEDRRTIAPNNLTTSRLRFGFTSWANNNTAPWADFLHLRSYVDASGGSDNLVLFRKDTFGMRIYQQTFGTSTAYTSFKDVAWTDGTNASGTWGISVTGNAATVSTAARTTNAAHYLTFVDANNASAAAENIYTTSTVTVNPATGAVGIGASDPFTKFEVRNGNILTYATSLSTAALFCAANSSYSYSLGINNGADFVITGGGFSGLGSELLRVTSNGNVGIGTTSPGARLEVRGGTNTLRLTNTSTTDFSSIQFYDGTATRVEIWAGNSDYANYGGAGSLNYSANSGPHVWYTNYSERMRIDASGNLKIGTSAGDHKLVVMGNSAIQIYNSGGSAVTSFRYGASGAQFQLGTYFSTGSSIVLLTNANAGGEVERLRITANGGFSFGSAGNNFGSVGQVLTSAGDAPPTWSTLSSITAGTATNVTTVSRTTNASHFLTFVDSNNASATAEAVYTTSTVTVNPATGAVGIGAGTAALPSVSFTGDPNTGFFSPAADTVAVSTGGVERLRLDAAGNLGLGVTPSASTLATVVSQYGLFSGRSEANFTSNAYFSAGWRYIDSDAATQYRQGSGVHQWFIAPSGTAGTAITFTQAMTLDATGNLGVGTASPRSPGGGFNGITIDGASSGFLDINVNSTRVLTLFGIGNDVFVANPTATGTLLFSTNGAERVRLDAAGNLGLGVTPSSWVDAKAIDINSGSGIFGFTNNLGFASNAFWNGANWVYKNSSAPATRYESNPAGTTGSHAWFNAASGTAGNAISFTQAMTLLVNGNLGIGTTSPAARLTLGNNTAYGNTLRTYNSESAGFEFYDTQTFRGGQRILDIFAVGSQTSNYGGGGIRFLTNPQGSNDSVERMFIQHNGNVGIGTTNPTYKLEVNGSFAATTKSFRIDHPSKPGMKLQYGSLESPYHGVRLTGRSTVVKGKCVVQLPDYVNSLVKEEGINIQITNYKHGKTLYVDDIDLVNNQFTVAGSKFGKLEFFWTFTAVRKDIPDLEVEV